MSLEHSGRPPLVTRASAALRRRPRLALSLLLAPPLGWLGVVYLGSLCALLVQSFFRLDPFSGRVVEEFSLETWRQLATPAHRDILVRTTTMAAAVTLACAALAFPLAWYLVFRARPAMKTALTLAVVLPLWSSFLVRVFAWKLILAREGILAWFVARAGLTGALEAVLSLPVIGGPSLSLSPVGIFLAFVSAWLPYMILPLAASLERVPASLIEASGDLGAAPGATFRHVIWPLVLPGLVAGSIFTFSLTLGDFVVPTTLGNSSFFLGQAVLSYQGTSGNIPLAAALTAVPMAVMGVYLLAARRLGAFDAL